MYIEYDVSFSGIGSTFSKHFPLLMPIFFHPIFKIIDFGGDNEFVLSGFKDLIEIFFLIA